ncbi:MAG TPA: DUF1549 domain-containing protein, partial [Lacipirellulaceae bacterium]|nr:DUF1549 domain-containing protein [Lacipirellulaceae bacterium]
MGGSTLGHLGRRSRLALLGVAAAIATAAADPARADDPAAAAASETSAAAVAVDDAAVVRRIDELVRAGWATHGVRPSPPASDREWCRRVYLDLIGRIPTVDELETFLRSPGRTRRAELVERLLGDEYRAEYARHWATLWTNLLIGRTGGTDRRARTSRAGMSEYLVDSFTANKPYDVLV